MTKERIGSLFFLAVGIFGLVHSLGLPLGTRAKPGPGVFPLALSILLTAVGALLLTLEKGEGRIDWGALARKKATVWKIAAISAGFILVFERLGYLATSALYLFTLFFWVCGFRIGPALGFTAALTLASWYLFGSVLGLQLPVGPWRL